MIPKQLFVIENILSGGDGTKLLILLVLLISRIKLMANGNILTVSIVNVFGTFLHETAHYLVGLILLARPVSFSVFPKKTAAGYTLGTVQFVNLTWWNAIPVAMAPLLLLVVAYHFDGVYYGWFDGVHSTGIDLGYVFGLAVLIDNAIPSSTDFKVAFGSVFIPVALLIMATLVIDLLSGSSETARLFGAICG